MVRFWDTIVSADIEMLQAVETNLQVSGVGYDVEVEVELSGTD